jgi:hypothetical protein
MVTTFRGIQNTSLTSASGGTQVAALQETEIARWAKSLVPTDTPFLNKVGFGKPVRQSVVYFGQSYVSTLEARLEGGIDASTQTINVEAGQGTRFWPTLQLLVANYQTTGDTTLTDVANEEIMTVTSVTADAVTVARGQSGTTGKTHSDGARVFFLAPAEAEGQYHQIKPVQRGALQSNNVQRLDAGIAFDKAAENLPTFEFPTGGQALRDFNDAKDDLMRLLERSTIYGGGQAEVPATPVARTMKGIRSLIVTNVYNYADTQLSLRNLENVAYDLWNSVDESAAKTWVMSGKTSRIINTFKNSDRNTGNYNDTSINTRVATLDIFGGQVPVMPVRNFPEGEIWLLDFGQIDVNPRLGLDFHITEKPGKFHGADHDQRFWSGDFTLTMTNEAAMARIHSFITDLDAYGAY